MATRYDLEFDQGDDVDLKLIVTKDGVRVPLGGRRVELLVKPKRQSSDLDKIFQLSTTTGDITITDVDQGEVSVPLIDHLETAGHFWYRAWVADVADEAQNRSTFLKGLWEVHPT